MDTVTVAAWIVTMEPGRHISRRTIAERPAFTIDLPRAECAEPRPDWGEYSPVLTFPAVERAIRRRGLFPPLASPDERYSFSVR